ncbi:TetR/AcrR family transcriptional regulator [Catenulispora yoronensis]|uniref:TetR/AcrR family transcriptional regulator n=1 Tax=Catenulispora yoronensis TaxID=450799 RepID=A0ABP5G4V6_9ACTN
MYWNTVLYLSWQEAIPVTKRLTRQQSRELTREQLLQAAAELFAESGVNGTSVEQIVERAGYTRGAFYGNFDGKREIVLALLEQRTQRELEEMQALSQEAESFDGLLEHLRTWHRERDETLAGWLALRTELWLYGMRDPELLPVLADRERRSRAALAQALEQGFAARSVTPPAPVEFLALIMHSLGDGLSIQRVLSPEDSDADVVVDAVELLMRSWSALARQAPDTN